MSTSDYLERVGEFFVDGKDQDVELEKESVNDRERVRTMLVKWRDEAEEALRPGFVKAERDWDYYDNKQLTDDEVAKLKERGQPPISINLIRRKIDFLRGMEIKHRTDPKAWPRTPADDDAAEIATDTLRYVFDAAHYNQNVRKWLWKDYLVVGWCGAQLRLKPGRGDRITQAFQMEPNPRLNWKRTAWDRMLWDPHSSDHDFTDSRFKGLVLWLDKDQATGMYRDNPEAASIISMTMDANGRTNSFADKPRFTWVDARKRVCIIQMWWKEDDKAYWAEFTQGGILKGGFSPFRNEEEEPCDNLIWQSCYVDRDNNRHGIVRDMIDPQDEVNKRRSKSLHLLTVRQVIADEGAVQDVEKARKQLARPDGWIVKTPGLELEIAQNADLTTGQMELLRHATAELEKMGPNEALQGQGAATSGRDRQAQQQGGLIELGPSMDDLMWVDLRAYNLSWTAVQDYWKAPQFIRITDNPDAPRFIGLNEPLMASPDQPVIDQMGQVAMRNRPAELNADIIVLPAPDTAAIEQEVWEKLMEIVPILAQLPPQYSEMAIEASPLPGKMKRRLIEILKQGGQQQSPEQQAAAQKQQQMGEAAAMLELEDKAAGVAVKKAQAAKLGSEAAQPTNGLAQPSMLDMAKVEETRAKTTATYVGIDKTKAETQGVRAKTMHTITQALTPAPHLMPQPKEPAGAQ